ncbi:MAG: hypothetical protein QF486_01675 [Candidatus Woesearchaeota archaeon]|nr:hypothetical protein [Candidatus Woesearchaeota archaeon]MDP7198301.1 hypothetical protein [Candidatus Woesearchaeota archaeon]MDP7467403.1 hypothetical protein [Candidatus Woesearchaeota archaeon]MDP7647630.1 hypothetical protein [Candidatus Woesearchaeota archaeon]
MREQVTPQDAFRHIMSTYHPEIVSILPRTYENILAASDKDREKWAFVAGVAAKTVVTYPAAIQDPIFRVVEEAYPSWLDDFVGSTNRMAETLEKVMQCTKEGTLAAAVRDVLTMNSKDN